MVMNFIDLIKEYKIEIPTIQRDYVQGNNEKIIKKFINKIFDVLEEKNDKLNLDFIYGTVNNGVFEPIDGQQRLTTIFLATIFIAKKEKVEEVNQFKEFSYAVKSTSEEFYRDLVNKIGDIPDNCDNIIEYIKNKKWYDENWQYDQTIQSSLKTLAEIQKRYNSSNTNLYEKIKSRIKFEFLDTQADKLDDDVYIKLNARGIALTTYEQFKTSFLEIRKYDKEFAKKFDITWADWIWKRISKDEYQKDNSIYDDAFSGIIKSVCINKYALENEINNPKSAEAEILKNIIDNTNITFIDYEKILKPEELRECTYILERLLDFIIEMDLLNRKELNVYIDAKEIIENKLINKNQKSNILLTNVERLEFFAITLFANQYYEKNDLTDEEIRENYLQWTRIARNIIPRTIDDNTDYTKKIKDVDKIFKAIKTNRNYLNAFAEKTIVTENKIESLKEEQIKAQIMQNEIWKSRIEFNDLNKFLAGRTEFLLEFCGIEEKINTGKEDENECLKMYDKYTKIVNIIFSKEGNTKIIESLYQNNILQRALFSLTKQEDRSGYLIELQDKGFSFLINLMDRDYSFRNLFGEGKQKNRIYFKELMDRICKKANVEDINEELIVNVCESLIEKSEIKDWKKYFIKDTKIFEMLNNRINKIRISGEGQKDIFIMNKESIYGKTLPLFFAVLQQKLEGSKLKSNEKDVLESATQGIYTIEGKTISNIDENEVYINVKWDRSKNKFVYTKDLKNMNLDERKKVEKALKEIEEEFEIKFESTESIA